jgi:hypothetical protein
MKKIVLALIILSLGNYCNAQGVRNILKKVLSKDTAATSANGVNTTGTSGLNTTDIISGLKEALQVGAKRSLDNLSATDGFFANAAVKILMPPEAKNVEVKLRALGLGKQVDNAILSMNRAAEDASKSAFPIFLNAIKSISIQDASNILRGGDSAATQYLRGRTTSQLADAFRPVVENALSKTNATKYWTSLFNTYNQFSAQKVNPDLTGYATEKALSGIFFQIGKEEQQIRKNPAARTSEILKKVFANVK